MKIFNKVFNKIIKECNNMSIFDKYLEEGYMLSPKKPFQITKDMMINANQCFDENEENWAGKVIEILSNDELLYEVCGKYIDKFNKINNDPFIIKLKLIPGNSYYICNNDDVNCKWIETLFNNPEIGEDIETEDGECCGGDIGGAGITTNSVFGGGNSAGDSVIQNSHKDPNGPGITTHDMRAMYTLHLDPRRSKKYPVFKRKTVK